MLFGEGGLAAIVAALGRRLCAVAMRLSRSFPQGNESSDDEHRRADGACLLEARSVSRRFGGLVAVDAVDLAVRRGSVHGLIGPNGAGKTTLLNLIAGVYRVSSGLLRFAAQDITQYSTAKRARAGIRRTFQNLKLFGEMTALENAAIGLHAQTRGGFLMLSSRRRGIAAKSAASPIDRWRRCTLSALPALPRRAPTRLRMDTGVYWKSPALSWRGRALLLLDEPAAGLNVTEAAHVSDLIARIRDEARPWSWSSIIWTSSCA